MAGPAVHHTKQPGAQDKEQGQTTVSGQGGKPATGQKNSRDRHDRAIATGGHPQICKPAAGVLQSG